MAMTTMKIDEETLRGIEALGTCRDYRADVLRILLYYWHINHPDGCPEAEWDSLRNESKQK